MKLMAPSRTRLGSHDRRTKTIENRRNEIFSKYTEVLSKFATPDGVTRSKVTTWAKTVLTKGITNEIEIAAKRDSDGWKRKLVFALTGKNITETITRREPKFINNTPDVELHWSEKQRLKNLVVSDSKDDANQLVLEIKDKKHIRDYVRYLSDYSEDTKVKTKAGQILGRAETEMRKEYLEPLKEKKTEQPKQTSTASDDDSSVERSVLLQCAACQIINRESEPETPAVVEEKGEIELSTSEKNPLQGRCEAAISKLFGRRYSGMSDRKT